jgi:hypothetical protein
MAKPLLWEKTEDFRIQHPHHLIQRAESNNNNNNKRLDATVWGLCFWGGITVFSRDK